MQVAVAVKWRVSVNAVLGASIEKAVQWVQHITSIHLAETVGNLLDSAGRVTLLVCLMIAH